MIEYILMLIILLGSIITLFQRDLLKAAIISGIPGVALALLYQYLLAPDVALTQAIIGTAILPVFLALTVYKTVRAEV